MLQLYSKKKGRRKRQAKETCVAQTKLITNIICLIDVLSKIEKCSDKPTLSLHVHVWLCSVCGLVRKLTNGFLGNFKLGAYLKTISSSLI